MINRRDLLKYCGAVVSAAVLPVGASAEDNSTIPQEVLVYGALNNASVYIENAVNHLHYRKGGFAPTGMNPPLDVAPVREKYPHPLDAKANILLAQKEYEKVSKFIETDENIDALLEEVYDSLPDDVETQKRDDNIYMPQKVKLDIVYHKIENIWLQYKEAHNIENMPPQNKEVKEAEGIRLLPSLAEVLFAYGLIKFFKER